MKGWSNGRIMPGKVEQCGLGWKGYSEANPFHSWRKLQGLSQLEVARQFRVSTATIAQWERAGIPRHGIDIVHDICGLDLGAANEQWRAEGANYTSPLMLQQRWAAKYEPLGAAVLAVETTQDNVRQEIRRKFVQRVLERRDEREMSRTLRALERNINRSAFHHVVARLEQAQREREARVLRDISQDDDYARKWMEDHAHELLDLKPDWHLYFGLPIHSTTKDDENLHEWTTGQASLNVIDASSALWLEDAVIAKIDKEREGYFVDLQSTSRGYSIHLLNDVGYLPAKTAKALDGYRPTRTRLPLH